MQKNHFNINKQFMIGNGILAFAVIFVVVLFIYLSFRLKSERETGKTYAEVYHIELAEGFTDSSISVYVNDSLLFDGTVKEEHLSFGIPRMAESCVLFVVDKQTGETACFNLNQDGGDILLERESGKVSLKENHR